MTVTGGLVVNSEDIAQLQVLLSTSISSISLVFLTSLGLNESDLEPDFPCREKGSESQG